MKPYNLTLAEMVATYLEPDPKIAALEASDLGRQPIVSSSVCSRPYQTLLHGDVKSENLFTTINGNSVAFYDFQYVGLGLGVSDLVKFFTCCAPLGLLLRESIDLDTTHRHPM